MRAKEDVEQMLGMRDLMSYLGLVEPADERYEDAPDTRSTRVEQHHVETVAPAEHKETPHRAEVTPINRDKGPSRVVPEPVRHELAQISTIIPTAYNDAKTIGESFREGVPVIMNLSEMDDSDAKRLVDFSAGLVYGLRGSIERITNKVFLLSPAHVEVSPALADTTKAAQQTSFYNQS